ncbi:MAG: PqqD family peptide modification chaperone [Candidatus Competibacteraceae bacterium]|nr:MAG: PqqD family peptide modification chaperone [Candidatus Competibacteraceae bacterium]
MTLPARWLAASIADHLVLARLGPQRGQKLLVLDPLAGWIWQSYHAGLRVAEIAGLLATRFGLSLGQARADVVALLEAWRHASEPETAMPNSEGSQTTVEDVFPTDPPPPAASTWMLQLADRRMALVVDDPALAEPLARIIDHLGVEPGLFPDHRLRLSGIASGWRLAVDGAPIAAGDAFDEAIARTVSELVEWGCDINSRLLVLHAAGLSQSGRGVLLIGQGGSGKTTLAAALNAEGFGLLGDDVIPVNLDGQLVGIGMSLCLKSGSWPVLASCLPNLDHAPLIERFGQQVRFSPPPGPVMRGPIPMGVFLFPHYRPSGGPTLEPLEPVAVLQRIVEAEPVISTLDPDRLNTLTRWVSSVPAFALTYAHLDQALALTERALVESGFPTAPLYQSAS